ncbi:hypothetical protein ASG87_05500 [Frateuria sp. Soil773]|uniref:HdeD family acid-resistance protein n=1 Tax=Frateuria sp. Soil773 TaxID=1736407 RepID=UPI0006F2A415|nr:HdeD family acid-resistance protein [Frateuria sp. Soil773]KRE89006.1 hypothetical protein ASG87_05500 [Frateuria sp. Soil773]
MTTASQHPESMSAAARMRARWAWLFALGIVLIGLGILAFANMVLATIATVYYVGLLMTVAGAIQLLHAIGARNLGGFFYWLSGCVLYLVAGITALMNPLLASFILTLLLGLFAAASGLSRIWLGFRAKARHGWGWIVASGLVTAIVGLIFIFGWPVNSLWLLGMVLAVDLSFQGCALAGLAIRLRTA